MRRLVISGAAGFLGTHIIRAATASGVFDVLAIVADGERAVEDVDELSLTQFLENGFEGSPDDIFVNCLFPTNADGWWMADGLEKVFRIILMAKNSGVGAFINISSQSVYDQHRDKPAHESDKLCLETPYAVGKYASEAYCNAIFENLPHSNLRLASMIGVGYEQRIINRLFDFALENGEIKIVGGMQRYGFLDVRDAATAIVTMADSDIETWRTVYNLGPSWNCTLLDIGTIVAELVEKHTGKHINCVVTEGNDRRNSSIDAYLFCSDFKWNPQYKIDRTSEEILRDKLFAINKEE